MLLVNGEQVNLKEIYHEIFFNFTFGHNYSHLHANSNDYFKALELFNLRKIEQSLNILKKLQTTKKMKKEVMQCLI